MPENAVVFAGQGAQFVGMGQDLVETSERCRGLFATADDVLGYALSAICMQGPIEDLTKSNHCQPGIFVTSLACYQALSEALPGLSSVAFAGLSLGEWTALHVAGVIGFEDTVRVLEARGRYMQEACDATEGGMLSVIGLSPAQLQEICAATGVQVANLNSAQQTVLSGPVAGITQAGTLATEAGAKRAIPLKVAGAFHSTLMEPAAERLAAFLAEVEFRLPQQPVMSNVTGQPHADPDTIRANMVRQVTSPVQWLACVEQLGAMGADTFVECGPGKVLTGLIRRIEPGAALHTVQDSASLAETVQALTV